MARAIPPHLQDKTFGRDRYTVKEIIKGRRKGQFFTFHPTPAERDQLIAFCKTHSIHALSLPTPARLFKLLRTIGYFNNWQPLDASLAHRLLDYICHPSIQAALPNAVAQDAWHHSKTELKKALSTYKEEAVHQQAGVEDPPNVEQQRARRPSLAGSGVATGLSGALAASKIGSSSTTQAAPPRTLLATNSNILPTKTISQAAPPPTPDHKALLTALQLKLPGNVTSEDLYATLERAAEQIRQNVAARDVEVKILKEQYAKAKKLALGVHK